MKQEELLGYIDRQEEAKYKVSLYLQLTFLQLYFNIYVLMSDHMIQRKKFCW